MPNVREIRNRIKSVKNIGQVTRALEAVSASRSRKAQQQALASRAYAQQAWEVLVNVASQGGATALLHPLLQVRSNGQKITILLISGDRGLAGAYNTNIVRAATTFASEQCSPGCQIRWIVIGRKGRDMLWRLKADIVSEFSHLPPEPSIVTCGPIAQTVIDEFLTGRADQVFIAYTDFINTLTQKPVVINLLPLKPFQVESPLARRYIKAEPTATTQGREYLYEPSASEILDEMLPRFTQLQIYQAILESLASEHSARMIAMRNASENAEALAADLQLSFNKARQLAITSEILDIVGGVEALRGQAEQVVSQMRQEEMAVSL